MYTEACIALAAAPIVMAYFIAHSILANILGHAILAIVHPDTYIHTLRSTVFSALYDAPIFVAILIMSSAGRPHAWLFAPGVTCDAKVVFIFSALLLKIILPIPAGAIINVLGILVLKAHGYHGPLPNLAQAARIGAVGHAVLIGVHVWRFRQSGSDSDEL
ncbi:hypothetical protein C8R44DRAFT_724178 [Mycena epipterygia]|nr:hypothetical protein C8R44DRAFT_724178 [Mycena epipterygia]